MLHGTGEDTGARARDLLPQTTTLQRVDTWFITALEVGARLALPVVEPSGRNEYLYIATVAVDFLDEMDRPTWRTCCAATWSFSARRPASWRPA
jgi:hypothetical protein